MARGVILTPNAAKRTRDVVRAYERRVIDMTRGRKREDAAEAEIDPPTEKYQVYTPIDDTLNPVWTSARFM